MKYSLLTTRQKPKDKAAIWHILLASGRSVCGRANDAKAAMRDERPARICMGCNLMKDADTVRGSLA
ncbi:MAG TPA: hypothetical protein VGI39_16895 [Polyangiaceae bacterium]